MHKNAVPVNPETTLVISQLRTYHLLFDRNYTILYAASADPLGFNATRLACVDAVSSGSLTTSNQNVPKNIAHKGLLAGYCVFSDDRILERGFQI
jgi:hypothetical protein